MGERDSRVSAPKDFEPLAVTITLALEDGTPRISSNATTRLDSLRLADWLNTRFELAAIVDLAVTLRRIAEREQTR